jgi:hypothetical protein
MQQQKKKSKLRKLLKITDYGVEPLNFEEATGRIRLERVIK